MIDCAPRLYSQWFRRRSNRAGQKRDRPAMRRRPWAAQKTGSKVAGCRFFSYFTVRSLHFRIRGSAILFRAAGLKKSRVYIINEIERGMPQTYTNKLLGNLQELKKAKVSILYLSSNLYFTAKVSERMIVPGDERIENILK